MDAGELRAHPVVAEVHPDDVAEVRRAEDVQPGQPALLQLPLLVPHESQQVRVGGVPGALELLPQLLEVDVRTPRPPSGTEGVGLWHGV